MTESPASRPVAVGVSGDQPALLAYAEGLATILHAPLKVVHAYSVPMRTADLYVGQDVTSILRDAAQRVLDEARERLGDHHDVQVTYALRFAPAADALVAESTAAAVLVLGTDDVGWFERLLGREVAQRASRHSSCPVLVVPPGAPAPGAGDVVVAIEMDHLSHDVIEFAFDLADRTGVDLHAVSVLAPGATGGEVEGRTEQLREATERWATTFPDVGTRHSVLSGDAASELDMVAASSGLVVLGSHQRPMTAPLIGHSLVAQLIRSSRSPVAVVPVGSPRPTELASSGHGAA